MSWDRNKQSDARKWLDVFKQRHWAVTDLGHQLDAELGATRSAMRWALVAIPEMLDEIDRQWAAMEEIHDAVGGIEYDNDAEIYRLAHEALPK